jgi:ATP-dependent DNA helicase DinG
MSIPSILGSSGAIAQRLKNYEPRPQQLDMAEAVAQAIDQRQHLMVEAGTGVGKSFAYLVPAIEAALADPQCRIVVSTHTISLQEQLIGKDIPFLQKVMPPFQALLVKGRSNYLSQRRLRVAEQRAASLLVEEVGFRQLQMIGDWAKTTKDGSRSDLNFKPLPPVWELVESDSSNCLGRRCKDFAECFYFQARKKIQDAQVLVVNHALYFTDLALRRLGKGFLPDHRVVIFDEGHTLEDVAADHLGLRITRGQADYLLRKLLHERGQAIHGLLSIHDDDATIDQFYRTRAAVENFFSSIHGWHFEQILKRGKTKGSSGESLRVFQPGIVPDELSKEWRALSSCLDRLVENLANPEEQIELEAAANRCEDFANSLESWLGQKLPEQVYWMEITGDGKRISLESAPIDVGPLLREEIFDRIPTVVLTSATMSIGGRGGFNHFKERLGFPDHPTLHLGSPFNYRQQVELHLFRRMPDPQAPQYEEAVLAKIQEYVQKTQGRAFVLFTSIQAMQRAADRLRDWCSDQGMVLLSQNDGLPATRMVERFKQERAAVLFGVDSFWQGVDIQGEALSNVIITKLPFVPPDRPLVQARMEAINGRGGNSFFDFQLPQAIIKLKQGFGRLIRTRLDHGLVVILDPRMVTKPYGREFLEALPKCRLVIDGVELPG